MKKPLKPQVASTRQQRGAATLIVALVLFFSLALAVAYASRGMVFEQRASANQARAMLAFEAAEAGLEWALAQLNATAAVGDDCQPSLDASARSFRDRYLQFDTHTRQQTPRTWLHAGQALALRPTCRKTTSGWACHCPSAGHPSLALPSDNGIWPAFSVQLVASDRPGVVTVVSQGCSQLGGACLPGTNSGPVDATARTEVTLALVGGLRALPAAPLTVRGNVQAPSITVRNTDITSGGLAVHAGGRVDPSVRLTTAAGNPSDRALLSSDATLHALSTERFFSSHFGLDKPTWVNQGQVTVLDCTSPCTHLPGMPTAPQAEGHARLLHARGDVQITGPTSLGSAQQPVLVVVDGDVTLRGAVTVHGLLYARQLRWDDGPAGGQVRGAILLEGDLMGTGAPTIHHDPAVLERLTWHAGSFVRVPGSWRDMP